MRRFACSNLRVAKGRTLLLTDLLLSAIAPPSPQLSPSLSYELELSSWAPLSGLELPAAGSSSWYQFRALAEETSVAAVTPRWAANAYLSIRDTSTKGRNNACIEDDPAARLIN